MNRTELNALHAIATETRDLAHKAYVIALQNRKADGDTQAAYHTLLKANQVRDRIYKAILALAVQNQELFTVTTNGSGRIQAVDPSGHELAAVGDLDRFEDDDPTPLVELARATHYRLQSLA